MSLLTVVREFCQRTGLSTPTAVANSSDPQIQQILALLNELLEEIVTGPYQYSALIKECTFTTVPVEAQGTLGADLAIGFKQLISLTMFNRSQNLRVEGPLSAQEWQQRKASNQSGTNYSYRIQENYLLLYPAPAAGQTIAFEYESMFPVYSYSGSAKALFSADDDVCVFPDSLLKLGLRWKWREAKGLDYITIRDSYQEQLAILQGKDGSKATIDMSGYGLNKGTGIIIPFGSYNQ